MFKALAAKIGKKKKADLKVENLSKLEELMESSADVSDDVQMEAKDSKDNDNHTTVIIYQDKKDCHLWICQNCETENLPSKNKCCVCYAER